MRVVCVYREGRDYSRTVTDWLEDLRRRTGHEIEIINPDKSPDFCEAYEIMEYPTIMALGSSGETAAAWKGLPLPLFDEVTYYINAWYNRLMESVDNAGKKPINKRLTEKRKRTYARMLKSIICTVLVIIIVLIVLQLLGVNVSSMLAGVGIVSIIVGFALQDALKDMIRGLEIISSNYYDIGDLIKFGDNLGIVQSITLRTTKIQDINSMNIVSIANRNIDKVEVDTGYIYILVPLPYSLKIEKADAVMSEIAKKLAKTELVTTAGYQGLTKIDSSSLNYQVVVTCNPTDRLQARRNSLHTIVETLEENKISIPYNQLDIHTK